MKFSMVRACGSDDSVLIRNQFGAGSIPAVDSKYTYFKYVFCRKQLGTEAYYYAMIDTPNDKSSDLK